MATVADLALARTRFPASFKARFAEPLPAQLLAARNEALATLQKYVPNFAFDKDAADQTLREVGAWELRNRDALAATLMDPASEDLPIAVQTALGQSKAQAFVVAGFTLAAVGLGPWTSGSVAKYADNNDIIGRQWAEDDAQARLAVFGSVIRMDEDGYLAKLFAPPGVAAAGFGLAPLVIGILVVIAVVAVAAVVLTVYYNSKKVADNNRLMGEICKREQELGHKDAVEQCIAATKGLQADSLIPGLDTLAGGLVKIGLVLGAIWLGFKLIPPMLEKRRAR